MSQEGGQNFRKIIFLDVKSILIPPPFISSPTPIFTKLTFKAREYMKIYSELEIYTCLMQLVFCFLVHQA